MRQVLDMLDQRGHRGSPFFAADQGGVVTVAGGYGGAGPIGQMHVTALAVGSAGGGAGVEYHEPEFYTTSTFTAASLVANS